MGEYKQRIDRAILDQTTLRDIKPNSGFYPSSASIRVPDSVFGESTVGGCLRQQYYRWFRFPEEPEPNAGSMGRLYLGNWAHDGFGKMLQSLTMGTGLVPIREEHAFWKMDYRLSGRSDILCYDLFKKKFVILELKTVNSEWGKSGYKTQPTQPKGEYLLQILTYLKTYEPIYPDIRAVILYINLMANFRVDFLFDVEVSSAPGMDSPLVVTTENGTETLEHYKMSSVVERWNQLEQRIRAQELPDRDYKPVYSEEDWCNLHRTGRLNYKKESEVIDQWLSKGAPEGELRMPYSQGDPACGWCQYRKSCEANLNENAISCPTTEALQGFKKHIYEFESKISGTSTRHTEDELQL